ncbi:hypothetical protein ACFL3C_05650 [Patescibacteria group bacterium]
MSETLHTPESTIQEPAYITFDVIKSGGKEVVRAQAGIHSHGCQWKKNVLEKTGERPCLNGRKWLKNLLWQEALKLLTKNF